MACSKKDIFDKCSVTTRTAKRKGDWLQFTEIDYVGADGESRKWESFDRTTRARGADADGVAVIALLFKSRAAPGPSSLILVKQFRPPLAACTLEFPAGGLIDENESPETAALRELKEETGYVGEVMWSSGGTCLEPGASGSRESVVRCHVYEEDNPSPTKRLDAGEFTEVVIVPCDQLQTRLELMAKSSSNLVVDCKLLTYALGLSSASSSATG